MLLLAAATALLGLLPEFPGDLQLGGSVQGLYGYRLDDTNPIATDRTASELRGQFRVERVSENGEFFGRLDAIGDWLDDDVDDRWEVREAYFKFRIGTRFDFKIGRQIVTWGTGDTLFVNDVFAKDFQSFLVGRDDQYLKAPQDAFRVEWYVPIGDLSVVWTPLFEPNRLPDGTRLSFYNPFAGTPGGGGAIVGDGAGFIAPRPERTAENGEFAVRLAKQLGPVNLAAYGYRGFFKNPVGFRPGADFPAGPDFGTPVHPRLGVYGASARGSAFGMLFWLEGGWNESIDDRDGEDPFLPNSTVAGFAGVERVFASVLTVNLQLQTTWMEDHDTYEAQQRAAGFRPRDEVVQLLVSRIQYLLLDDTLNLTALAFFSPTEEEGYFRFSAGYAWTDFLSIAVGANVFEGKHVSGDLGQFKKNDNVWVKTTFSF